MPMRIPRLKTNPPTRAEVERYARAMANGMDVGPYHADDLYRHLGQPVRENPLIIRIGGGALAEGGSFRACIARLRYPTGRAKWEPITVFSPGNEFIEDPAENT